MFLAVRSFNSLHTAGQLLEHGYYQQALALLYMAMEDQLEDADNPSSRRWTHFDDKGSISSGDLTVWQNGWTNFTRSQGSVG